MTDDDKMDFQALRLAVVTLIAQLLTAEEVAQLSSGMTNYLASQQTADNVVNLRAGHPGILEVTARAVAVYDHALALRQRMGRNAPV